MRACFFILLLGAVLVPSSGYAIIPTADIPGTIQAMTEVGHTINNVKETATQVSQYQKTMAAIGTAVKSVSEYIANQKEKLEEKLQKLAEYKEQLEEYKAKAEAYKAAAEEKLNQVQEYKEQAQSAIDSAKETASSLKDNAQAALDNAKAQATGAWDNAKSQVTGFVDNTKSTLTDAVDQAKAKAGLSSTGVAEDTSGMTDSLESPSISSGGEAGSLVDLPVDEPSRQPIVTASEALLSEETPASTSQISFSKEQANPSNDADVAQSNRQLQSADDSSDLNPTDTEVKTNTAALRSAIKPQATTATTELNGVSRSSTSNSLKLPSQENISPAVQVPTRSSFKSSGVYRIRQSYPLSFASFSLDIANTKGGTTPNKVLVVPESLSLYCGLDYEKAAEEDEFDKCMKEVSAISESPITEEYDEEDIANAERDIYNGLAEYIAAAYLEAFNIYNDSITFKTNMIDPVTTAEMDTVEKAWSYSKEMNRILGTRYNTLNRLWARSLGVQMYKTYAMEKFKEDEEEN